MNSQDIDQLINDNINNQNDNNNNENDINYDLLIFSDGGYERVKKRSAFGIYVYNDDKETEFNKFNNTKIIKKIDKDLLFYNNKNLDIIYYNYIHKNNSNIKCISSSCNSYGIYNDKNEYIGKYCKNHKQPNMDLVVNYFIYEATNIRAEGLGILYSLIYIKLISIDKITDKDELSKNLILDHIYNIQENMNVITKNKLEEYVNKFLIVTDSEFWINVITKWSNSWIKKKQYLDKKNVDIVLYINYYLSLLNNNKILINFQHVRGHADKKSNVNDLDIYQKGNIMADKLVNIGKENQDLSIIIK
jgi:ribonuclease HI